MQTVRPQHRICSITEVNAGALVIPPEAASVQQGQSVVQPSPHRAVAQERGRDVTVWGPAPGDTGCDSSLATVHHLTHLPNPEGGFLQPGGARGADGFP